jgi:hypothetical protein
MTTQVGDQDVLECRSSLNSRPANGQAANHGDDGPALHCNVGIVTTGAALLARREAFDNAHFDLAAMAQTMANRLDQNMFERYR